jgi:hypothetical protein
VDRNVRPLVLGVTHLLAVEVIDSGDTVAVRLVGPDDREVALLLPQRIAADLQASLTTALKAAAIRGQHR